MGIAYCHGLRSSRGLSSGDERGIDLVEAYYAVELKDNIILTPSIQLVMDPGGLTSESQAIVFGLRCRVKF